MPLVPFHFLDLGPRPVAPVIRYFPFILSAVGLIAWLSNGWSVFRGVVTSSSQQLVGWQAIVLTLGAIGSVSPAYSGAKVIWYLVTGEMLWVIAITCLERRESIVSVIRVMVIAAGMVAAVAVLESFWGFRPLGTYVLSEDNPLMAQFSSVAEGQAVATIGNPNPLGTYLVLCLPFVLTLALGSTSRTRQGLLLIVALSLAVGLYLSYSRGALVAGVVMLALYAYPVRWLRAASVAVATVGVVAWGSSQGLLGSGRLGGVYDEVTAGWEQAHRLRSLEYVAEVWAARPLLGVGTGCYKFHALPLGSENDTPDNAYLLRLAESGVAGLVLHLALLVVVMRALRQATVVTIDRQHQEDGASGSGPLRDRADELLLRAFVSSVGGFYVSMGTWDASYFPLTRVFFWLVAGLGVAYARVVVCGEQACQQDRWRTVST